MNLEKQKCLPCEGKVPPLSKKEATALLKELEKGWKLVGKKIIKDYKFKDFKIALKFVNLLGKVAEKEGHHPDVELGYGYVKLTIWTHSINGLSRNDFILAAKVDHQVVKL